MVNIWEECETGHGMLLSNDQNHKEINHISIKNEESYESRCEFS